MAGSRYFGFNTTEAITLRNLLRNPPTLTQRGSVLKQTAVAPIAAPTATDLPTVITMSNEQKTQLNALITKLRAAGILV